MGLFKTIEEAEEIVSKIFNAVETLEKGFASLESDFHSFREGTNDALDKGKATVDELKATFQKKAKSEPAEKQETEEKPDSLHELSK